MTRPSLASDVPAGPAPDSVPPVAGIERLWAETHGDPQVVVAILDGPVDRSHPCLHGALLDEVALGEFAADALRYGDNLASLHGTHVASIVFGRHHGGVPGIARDCRGLIVPVFRADSHGGIVPCSQLDLARAITSAVTRGSRIINISGGQLDASGEPEPALGDALKLCADEDVLVVAAAGNDGCECLHLPAADGHVLVVGAMDATGEPLSSSNWPAGYRDRGILAPGEGIVGAVPGGGTTALSGTSFAAAIVSGVAALLMSIQWKRLRVLDACGVHRALLEGAVGCDELPAADCRRVLSGRLHAARALAVVTQEFQLSHPIAQGPTTAMTEHNHQSAPTQEAASEGRIGSFLENGGSRNDAPASATRLAQVAPPTVERTAAAPSPERASAVDDQPSPATKAGCGCGTRPRTLVYALGQIDYDFGTEANRDAFLQQGLADPSDPAALLAHLDDNPWSAENVIWTLVRETTPVYAVRPAGPFAREGYARLHECVRGQLEEGVSQVSIPGVETGEAMLLNGQTVPVVAPDLRGMCSWSTPALVKAVLGARPKANGRQSAYDCQAGEIANFLDRVYYELSNLGLAPQERAINYAATNAWQAAAVYRRALDENMKLDTITAERSRVCRPGADCWDVKLSFFDPARSHERARVLHRFTVDVSEVIPVTVGKVRSWEAY